MVPVEMYERVRRFAWWKGNVAAVSLCTIKLEQRTAGMMVGRHLRQFANDTMADSQVRSRQRLVEVVSRHCTAQGSVVLVVLNFG